jgi:hypothetical protein
MTRPNTLQGLLNSSGIGGLASAGGSSISNFFKGFGGSNISGTPAANVPYTGQPSGSLAGNSVADQESNQYFDLPEGVKPDGKGGYVNEYGYTVNANGAVIGIPSNAGGYDQYMPDVVSSSPGGSAGDYDYTPPYYSNTVVSDNGNSDLLANADVNMGFDPNDPNYWYA